MNDAQTNAVFAPQRWGLLPEAVHDLADRLRRFWERFRWCFKTKTRDASLYAYHYLSGQLRMGIQRNFANIGRQTGVPEQNVQRFMSNSPWSAQAVFRQAQAKIAATPGLERGGMLILDESADERAGAKSAGTGRQHNGRLGKVETSQVGTFLACDNWPIWTWVDGELFLQEHWFTPEMADEGQHLGSPPERQFETKIELGWKMIQRVKANGLPFEAVACDDLYGRSTWLRAQLRQADTVYIADVPQDTQVYLARLVVSVPEPQPGHRGRRPMRRRVLSEARLVQVRDVARRADTHQHRVCVRVTERGELNDEFAVRRVWTLQKSEAVQERLVIRREADGGLHVCAEQRSGRHAPGASGVAGMPTLLRGAHQRLD